MKGSEDQLITYLQRAKTTFIIPVYQRYYSWKTENCKQLYADLLALVRDPNPEHYHFFGSIVSVVNPKGANTDYLVIDGQQRLTTVSLLLLALRDIINEDGQKSEDDAQLATLIYQTYLYNIFNPKGPKLRPVERDRKPYADLFNGVPDLSPDSRMVANYKYFRDRLQKDLGKEYSYNELFNAICRLQIICITLDRDDDPQRIFESLNSTGLALSEGDKIRNFILMGQKPDVQDKFYTQYWEPIELNAGDADRDISTFVRDYLSVKLPKAPSLNKVYFAFKAYVEETYPGDMQAVLKELLAYARRYKTLLGGKQNAKNNKEIARLNASICRINRLEMTTTRPFLLEVLRLNEEGVITDAETTEIFTITETYVFRRAMYGVPTNSLNKIFPALHREITGYDGTTGDYVAKFKYALLLKSASSRFPRDDEFKEAFAENDVYTSPRNRDYILERLENRDEFMNKDIYGGIEKNVYSIEHIMPQKLTPRWREDLGADHERVHKTWLHRVANLTITAHNSAMSNLSFREKKTAQGGLGNDSIYLNGWIARQDKWTEEELIERSRLLTDEALKIWPLPVTSFVPAGKTAASYSLDEDDDASLTGKKITGFIYKDTKQTAKSWRNMFEQVLKMLNSEDRSELQRLAAATEEEYELARYVSGNGEGLRTPLALTDGVYVESNLSTQALVSLLRKFFAEFDVEPSELTFILSDQAGDQSE